MQDCVRTSGKAKIEVEIKEGTDVVSSFYIEAFIEKTSKEDITSDNASIYIEEYERQIASLQEESEELLANIEQAAATEIESIEQRYQAITADLNELLANYNEVKTYIEEIQDNLANLVEEQMSNYLLNTVVTDTVTKEKDFVITNNTEIIFEKQYQVRK